MSLMAGFDFVSEISNATLLDMIKANADLDGVPLRPPFELTLPFPGGSAHVVVDGMELDLHDDDTLSLHFNFLDTSAVLGSPPLRVVCKLSGTISVRAPIELAGLGSSRQITVATAAATVDVTYSAQAEQTLADDLAGSGLTVAQFKALADQAITSLVRGAQDFSMPMGFNVVSGDGSLNPLRFSSVQVHCIGHSDRTRQALGVFGNLLAATQNNGDHTQKTATAIPAGSDMAVSISPGAFHALVFCPAAANSLNVAVNDLPTTCGSSSGLGVQGVTLESMVDTFADGAIHVGGRVAKSGFCYDADGTFHGVITLTASGSQIQPHLHMDEPDVDIDIPWYCYLAVGVVLGPISVAVLAIVDAILDKVVDDLASSALKDALGEGISGLSVGGTNGTFTGVDITPEGVTLRGSMWVSVPTSTFWKHHWLDGSVTTASKTELSSGIHRTRLWCKSEAQDYPYTEYGQHQVATYDVESQLVAIPIGASYSLRPLAAGASAVPLSGTSGTVTLENVETTYQTPLATGGTKVTQEVQVDYEVNGAQVKLRNRPEQGNFSVHLLGELTDCGGQALSGQGRTVVFTGNNVEFGGTYNEDYQDCMDELRILFAQLSDKFKQSWQFVPIWVKVNYPAPEAIVSQIRVLTEAGEQITEDILLESRLAHGASFVRAFHADSETQLGRTARPEIPVRQIAAEEASVKAQIAQWTARLEDLARVRALGHQPAARKNLLSAQVLPTEKPRYRELGIRIFYALIGMILAYAAYLLLAG